MSLGFIMRNQQYPLRKFSRQYTLKKKLKDFRYTTSIASLTVHHHKIVTEVITSSLVRFYFQHTMVPKITILEISLITQDLPCLRFCASTKTSIGILFFDLILIMGHIILLVSQDMLLCSWTEDIVFNWMDVNRQEGTQVQTAICDFWNLLLSVCLGGGSMCGISAGSLQSCICLVFLWLAYADNQRRQQT
jgi:hypothetical protein